MKKLEKQKGYFKFSRKTRHPLALYTLNTIRQNKRTSLSIMASVLLAATLLCAMCTYGYTQLQWRVEIEEYENGQWHGELGGEIPARQLEIVENNLYVETTMLKGPFTCLKLSDTSSLPYLLLRDADKNYWDFMGEKNTIIEGRIPEKIGEIAVSKSFFEQNPEYHLGDTIALPKGDRMLGENKLDETQTRQKGESFSETGTAEVTLVGKMDLTTNTTIPGYYAMGYMDRASLAEEDNLVIYVKFQDIRKTYELLPQIADAMGIEKDEYGQYKNHFGYHTMLLALNFIFPKDTAFSLENIGVLLSYGMILLLAMGAFVMIICGAFQVSATARMKQLGMFRSVGATPMQIAASILMEGMILSVIPVLLSIGIGYLFTVAAIQIYTDIAGELLYFPITVHFSPLLALLSAALSFLTVLLAALMPAIKIARLSPLEAIRTQDTGMKTFKIDNKRRKRFRFPNKLTGYEAELARASHHANRRGFRASVLSLTFCLMLLIGFLAFMRLNDFLSERNRKANDFNIYVRIDMAAETDRELLEKLQAIPGGEDSVYYCVTRMAYWASPDEETDEFKAQGGFAGLNLNQWALVNRDGKYRIRAYLYGMEEEHFNAYCRSLGENPAEYYNTEEIKALAWSAAPVYPDVVNNDAKSSLSYSHLKLTKDQELLLLEKTEDSMNTDYVLPIEVGAVASDGPRLGDIRNSYNLNFYMPLSVYYSVINLFSGEKAGNYYTYLKVKTSPEDDIMVTDQITELCEAVIAKEDTYIMSTAKEEENNAVGMRAMEAVVNFIGILLGLIGVSNTLSAVSHTMIRRRREFAMLRSVGMDMDGVKKLLSLEGIRIAVTPVFIALPAVALLLQLLMCIVDVSWLEFFPFLPWKKIILSIAAVMAAVVAAYQACAGRIKKDTIINAVRDENV